MNLFILSARSVMGSKSMCTPMFPMTTAPLCLKGEAMQWECMVSSMNCFEEASDSSCRQCANLKIEALRHLYISNRRGDFRSKNGLDSIWIRYGRSVMFRRPASRDNSPRNAFIVCAMSESPMNTIHLRSCDNLFMICRTGFEYGSVYSVNAEVDCGKQLYSNIVCFYNTNIKPKSKPRSASGISNVQQ